MARALASTGQTEKAKGRTAVQQELPGEYFCVQMWQGYTVVLSSFLKIKDLLQHSQYRDNQRPFIIEVIFPSKLINMTSF